MGPKILETVIHELSPHIQQDLLAGVASVDEIVAVLARKRIEVSRDYLESQLSGLSTLESIGRAGGLLTDRRTDPLVLRLSDDLRYDEMHPAIALRYRQLTGCEETLWDVACAAKAQAIAVPTARKRRRHYRRYSRRPAA